LVALKVLSGILKKAKEDRAQRRDFRRKYMNQKHKTQCIPFRCRRFTGARRRA
jgi:hypothetical protein